MTRKAYKGPAAAVKRHHNEMKWITNGISLSQSQLHTRDLISKIHLSILGLIMVNNHAANHFLG